MTSQGVSANVATDRRRLTSGDALAPLCTEFCDVGVGVERAERCVGGDSVVRTSVTSDTITSVFDSLVADAVDVNVSIIINGRGEGDFDCRGGTGGGDTVNKLFG